MVLYSRNPRIIPDSPRTTPFTNPATADFAKSMTIIHKEAQKALDEAAGQMKAQYDKGKRTARNYQIGDHVWLDSNNLSLPHPKKKLNDKRVGPFEIVEKAGASAYKLKLPPHWRIHPCFNEKLLTPYVLPAFPNQELPPPPPPDLINDEEEFEIEEVLDSQPRTLRGWKGKKPRKAMDYFVKWKGWTREHNSWVHNEEMGNAQEAIEEYEERMNSVRRLDATKIITKTHQNAMMILDHDYQHDGTARYLTQWNDGSQLWVKDSRKYCFEWTEILKQYWENQLAKDEQDPASWDDPDAYL